MADRRSWDRIAWENSAQHILRAEIDPATGAELLGISVDMLKQLAAAAELRRPARCKVRCRQRPACPYCDGCLEIALKAAVPWPVPTN